MNSLTSTRPRIRALQARQQRRKLIVNAVSMLAISLAIAVIVSIVYIVLVVVTV